MHSECRPILRAQHAFGSMVEIELRGRVFNVPRARALAVLSGAGEPDSLVGHFEGSEVGGGGEKDWSGLEERERAAAEFEQRVRGREGVGGR